MRIIIALVFVLGLLAGCDRPRPATPSPPSKGWGIAKVMPSTAVVNLRATPLHAKDEDDTLIVMTFDTSPWPDENLEHCEKEERLLDWTAYEFHYCETSGNRKEQGREP